jgi:hypothetical protein
MPIIPPGGGGGGGTTPPTLVVSPSGSLAFGSVAVGSTADISISISNGGDSPFTLNTVIVGGAPYSLIGLPVLPKTVKPLDVITFTLRFSPTIAGTFNDSLSVTTSSGTDNSPYSTAISGTAPGAGGALNVSPSPIIFPNTILTHAAAPIVVTVKNVGSANVVINTIALLGGAPFGLTGLPALPLTLVPNATTTFNVTATPGTVGFFADTVRIGTAGIGNVDTGVQIISVALIPVGIITDNLRRLLFSSTTSVPVVTTQYLDPSNLNGQQASTLIFNGTIWDVPGFEKKLRRIRFWYENFGVAVLTVTVSSWRPNVGSDSFDQKTANASFGTVLADQTERTGFFDVQISGEIIIMQISRAGGGGAVSLLGFLPEFEDGGEKVEGN